MKWLILLSAGVVSSNASAETKVGTTPDVGVERTATVGSPIYEKFRYDVAHVGIALTDAVKGTLTGNVTIPAVEPLYQVTSKAKYKACLSSGPCALDDNGDGKFDRIALDETVRAFRLDAPVAYEIREMPVSSSTGNFRQIVTYLGAAGDTLRLSYREFMNDMARPAFTEELTFPLAKTFPQPIAFKDVKITLLSVDGAGLQYRIEP